MIRSFITRSLKPFLIVLAFILLSGCAASGGIYDDPRDPLEGLNRSIYSFNSFMDEILFEPIIQLYKAITPDFVEQAISNIFSNLGEVVTIANDFLQFKFAQMFSDIGRFIVNSTLGLVGIFDVSTDMGMEKHNEDFGQTLAVWGVGSGPYLMAPFLGPITLRDAIGRGIDSLSISPNSYVNNDTYQYGLMSLNYVSFRADLLGTGEILSEAALDDYEFMKSAYFEFRNAQINDVQDTNALPEGLEDAINFE